MPDTTSPDILPDPSRAIIEKIHDKFLDDHGIEFFLKREDLIHPAISGNKWRKLKYNLQEARERGFKKILTFGGAYSNHIYAMAAAGRIYGFETIGVIRGEPYPELNPTLACASGCGMVLYYLDRKEYKEKFSVGIQNRLQQKFGEFYQIPEGGSNLNAIHGCAELAGEIGDGYDMICLAVGTGGTTAGLLEGFRGKSFVLGFPVLKNGSYLRKEILSLNSQYSGNNYRNFLLNTRYHFGGYARYSAELIRFINIFHDKFGVPLDPVYTGKMMFGIWDLIGKGRLKDMKILAIHTGGLQGIAGFNQRYGPSIHR